ncbi:MULTISPECIES: pentapeptide repeat-containing protein [unclassified Streptomyces]|uniref:pentapeptide repeat-containing protein n=1 Tax=unclassified Streptomyces TaxID=2593676 RepID=UPI00224F99E5|nr:MULTISPECIES: pentapeptide repeat-containing protein [unclassified Streptomyces]MCX4526555.1 pentapeptide repeat-containing protein [Streptomyces sp. NBC_01551]MCX4542882.1 pentapeptide repeat-containing protein [Streptomyces sp. NBC_01565]
MVRKGQAGQAGQTGQTVKAARRAEVRLPELVAWAGGELEPDGDYDGLEFADLDLAGQEGVGARFMDCAVRRCALDEAGLAKARFLDSVLEGVRGVGTDLSGASLRDVELVEARLGGVQSHGAVWERVVVRGGKIDYLNLRMARLKDVVFDGCVLVEPDFGGAVLERVEFRGCAVRGADFTGARMADVDLRGAAELDVARGVEALAGAVISPGQLFDLAPALAAQLGLRVLP